MSSPTAPVEANRAIGTVAILRAFVTRELWTAVLQRTYAALGLGLVVVVVGIAWAGGGVHAGYVPTILDLLTPLELLVPVAAMAFGYRAVLNDERRGELDVLGTYPVSSWHVVVGIYVGRAIGLVVAVSAALLFVMIVVSVTEASRPLFYATHTGADSVGLYLRFVVLTVLFALVLLAVAVAISALVSTTRTAIAAVGLSAFVLLIGADLALVYGLASGIIGESSLVNSLAMSPLSAYRGLVLETSVATASGTGPQTAAPLASLLGLAVWWVGALGLSALAAGR